MLDRREDYDFEYDVTPRTTRFLRENYSREPIFSTSLQEALTEVTKLEHN